MSQYDGYPAQGLAVGGLTSLTPWTENIDAAGFDLFGLGVLSFTNLNTSLQQSGADLQYDVATGGVHFFRINNAEVVRITDIVIDVNGLDIEDVDELRFDAGATMITKTGSNMEFDVALGGLYDLVINSVSEYTLDATALTLLGGNNLVIVGTGATGFMDIGEITTPANPNANVGRLYVKDVAAITTLFFRDSAGTETDLLAMAAGQTPWLSDIDADGFDLTDLSNIEFRISTGEPAGSTTSIFKDAAGNMVFNVPTGELFTWDINAVTEMSLGATGLVLTGNLTIPTGQSLVLVDGNTTISNVTADIEYDVDGANTHRWRVANVTEMELSATSLDLQGNNLIMGAGLLQFNTNTTIALVTFDLEYDVATAQEHRWRVDNVNEMILTATGLDLLDNNLTSVAILEFTDANTSIQQSTTNLQFDVATGGFFEWRLNNSLIASMNDSTLILQSGMDLFISGGGELRFDTGETISMQANDMIFDVTVGDIFSWDIAGTPEMTLSAAELNLQGNDLRLAGVGAAILFDDNNHNIVQAASDMRYNTAVSQGHGFFVDGAVEMRIDATALTLSDAIDIIVNATTGTKIATATTQKLGFWNATPIVQTAHIADPAGGATIDAEARTAINAINAMLAATGLTAAA